MSVRRLDEKTSHHLKVAQVIPDFSTIVKELIENSVDANSTSIGNLLLSYHS